jgi:diadenosine tetraphosphate (Ap4A) HIT family hydrolase
VIENPEKNQSDLAKILNKSQSSISEALKRGGFEEVMNMNEFYKNKISQR